MNDSFSNYCVNNETFLSNDNKNENKNTDIGYNQEEINATSTEDLIIIRKAIFAYLKSPNLKKRNPNYVKAFKRINEELKKRKIKEEEKGSLKFESFSSKDKNGVDKKRENDYDNKYKNLICKEFKEKRYSYLNTEMLKRKRANAVDDSLNIPAFLQDKLSKEKKKLEEDGDILFDLRRKNQIGNEFDMTKESYSPSKIEFINIS